MVMKHVSSKTRVENVLQRCTDSTLNIALDSFSLDVIGSEDNSFYSIKQTFGRAS